MSETAISRGAGTTVWAEGAPKLASRISFSAVLVGGLVAIAVGIMLNMLGVAIGAATVDPVDRDTPSAQGYLIGAGVWTLVSTLIALALGGYVAARLSGNVDRRDSALHGLGVWSIAVLVSAMVMGSLAAGSASVATRAAGSAIGGAGQALGQVAGQAAQQVDPRQLVERARSTLGAPADPQRMTTEQRGAEMTTIIGRRVAQGSFSPGERERLSALIAAEAGISQDEAQQRVTAYERQAEQTAAEAERRAREAADAAASATAAASFWAFAALILGAAAAVIGATIGARDTHALTTVPAGAVR